MTLSGSVHARLLTEHDELDTILDQLIAAFHSDDWSAASAAYKQLERRLSEHFAMEEQMLFPDFAQLEPHETDELRAEHRAIRARIEELGVGVDLHQTRLTAVKDLAQMLRAHAQRENDVLYRWADHDAAQAPKLETFFTHARSPSLPVP